MNAPGKQPTVESAAQPATQPATVILVDDEEEVRLATGQTLELEGFRVLAFARAERALERVGQSFDGVLVCDIRMPKMDGMELLAAVQQIDPDLPVILITGHGDVPLAVEAMRQGAYDFVSKPFSPARLVESVLRAVEMRRLTLENREMRDTLEHRDPVEEVLVGRSAGIVDLRQKIRTVAGSEIDVLIQGETGTGKELVARAIHDLSPRREGPFVALNLAALPAASIESELFGHEAGAFIGAHRARYGKFEHAQSGTLYLDDIGAAPLDLQTKLLRVIEERAIVRVGSNDRIPLDVRFIASTNRDLAGPVAEGRFRKDLFYRLAVLTLPIPPLRERLDDAPRLFQHLVNQAAHRFRKEPPEVGVDVLGAISAREWPGNVRELRNAAERFVLGFGLDDDEVLPLQLSLPDQVERFEKSVIATALTHYEGNLKATYEALGVSRKTLYEKMQRYNLRRHDFEKGQGF